MLTECGRDEGISPALKWGLVSGTPGGVSHLYTVAALLGANRPLCRARNPTFDDSFVRQATPLLDQAELR